MGVCIGYVTNVNSLYHGTEETDTRYDAWRIERIGVLWNIQRKY